MFYNWIYLSHRDYGHLKVCLVLLFIGWFFPHSVGPPVREFSQAVKNFGSHSQISAPFPEIKLRSQLSIVIFYLAGHFGQERTPSNKSHLGPLKIGVRHIWACLIYSPSWQGDWLSQSLPELTWECVHLSWPPALVPKTTTTTKLLSSLYWFLPQFINIGFWPRNITSNTNSPS